jgi:hypothetical protein
MSNRAFLASQVATARTHTEVLSSWERDSVRQSIHGRDGARGHSGDRTERSGSERVSRGRVTRG